MSKDNPKDNIARGKVPLDIWPESCTVLGSMALLDGALKYGKWNFRGVPIKASVYISALRRHMLRWAAGQDIDEDSGLPNLAHALACIAILIDAEANGTLIDDREFMGQGTIDLLAEMTKLVPALHKKYADKSPKHYTILDNPPTDKDKDYVEKKNPPKELSDEEKAGIKEIADAIVNNPYKPETPEPRRTDHREIPVEYPAADGGKDNDK